MAHFTPIVFVDIFDLAASLRERMGLFKPDRVGEHILPIRGNRKDTDPAEDNFVGYANVAKWVELKNALSRIKRLGDERLGEVEVGRIFLEMIAPTLNPGPWRREIDPYFERFTRLHLPIRTNPAAMMLAWTGSEAPEVAHLRPGHLTIINVRVPHTSINLGEWPRIHLVIDFRKKA